MLRYGKLIRFFPKKGIDKKMQLLYYISCRRDMRGGFGFIGEKYERPRKTLLEGLAGDVAFYDEEQKKAAAARRKARKLNNASA